MIEYNFPQFVQFKTVSMIEETVFIYHAYKFFTKFDGYGYDYHVFVNTESGQELTVPLTHLEYYYTGNFQNLN
jgi:hypothetical protein